MTWQQLMTLGLLVWNIVVALLYLWDKYQASRGGWRVPERRLLSVALFCGGFGAILTAQLIRHKTRRWLFHVTWWLGLVTTLGALYLIWR